MLAKNLNSALEAEKVTSTRSHWVWNQTKPQVEAYEWIRNNVDSDAYIVMDCYPYVDLHEARFPGDKVFTNSDWFWKFWYDPEIQEKFGKDWQNVEYLLVTHEMSTEEEAKAAIEKGNGQPLDGRNIAVSVAKPMAPRENNFSRDGGGGRGGYGGGNDRGGGFRGGSRNRNDSRKSYR